MQKGQYHMYQDPDSPTGKMMLEDTEGGKKSPTFIPHRRIATRSDT